MDQIKKFLRRLRELDRAWTERIESSRLLRKLKKLERFDPINRLVMVVTWLFACAGLFLLFPKLVGSWWGDLAALLFGYGSLRFALLELGHRDMIRLLFSKLTNYNVEDYSAKRLLKQEGKA